MNTIFRHLRLKFPHWLAVGLCLSILWSCGTGLPTVDSTESAEKVLLENVLPNIQVEDNLVSDQLAARYSVDQIDDPLPALDTFPLYSAEPSTDANTVYVEIFSSSEKANAEKQDERWLVDVADAFNAQQPTTGTGQPIRVGVRNVPSGLAVRILAENGAKPAGYTPANALWLQMLRQQSVGLTDVAESLAPNYAGFVVQESVYQELGGNEVSFDKLLDAILGGRLKVGYPNPYASSTALNLLYTLLWRGAGHDKDGQPLTVAELQLPQISSLFEAFQKQVLITTRTTLDLKEIFIRDPDKLQAFPLEYQSYVTLKQLPGFEQTGFIPFGVPHNSPLVGFEWNTPAQQEALQKFADFALSPDMQQLAKQQGFEETAYLRSKNFPPLPSGEILTEAQSFWKQRKDGGRTVYMMVVIDTSGSMEGDRLQSVKEGLKLASKDINSGNYVGLVTFGDRPVRRLPLAAYDTLQQQKLLAAVDDLTADGSTAMYDGVMVALSELMQQRKTNPDGRFYLLLLSDGETNQGFAFDQIKDVLAYSDVRFYPIAYGEVNQEELQAIASLRESTVQQGNPANVQNLLRDLFQTNL
ncbi:MAG TPA: VWA domain-containing protein [Chroococcidiopsis sp.]